MRKGSDISIHTGEDQDVLLDEIKNKYREIIKIEFNTVWNPNSDGIVYSILVVGWLLE